MNKETEMAEFSPNLEQIVNTAPPTDTLPALPTHGRQPSVGKRTALALAGLATVLSGVAAKCNLWPSGSPDNSPSIPPPVNSRPSPTGGLPSMQTPLETQSPDLPPSPPPSETPKPVVTPNTTFGSEAPSTPEPSAELNKILESWLDGTYKIPPLFNALQGTKVVPTETVNVLADESTYKSSLDHNSNLIFQTVVLGQEVVDNHLIVYLGQRDKAGNRYYFGASLGNVTDQHFFTGVCSVDYITSSWGNYTKYPYPDVVTFMKGKYDTSMLIQLFTRTFPADYQWPDSSWNNWGNEMTAQRDFSLGLEEFSVAAAGGSYKSASNYGSYASFINHRVTTFDATTTPFIEAAAIHTAK